MVGSASENGKTSIADLQAEDAVRWVGQHQPGWRLAPLGDSTSRHKALAVVPTPDLGVGGYAGLATDMVQYGAVEASCDAWMCLAVVDATSARTLVHHLAHDGRVLWTEPTSELRVHNALAWSIAGVQNVANNATFTLDGSGEMIAIADTGLDRNHPDLTGRVAATYTHLVWTRHLLIQTAVMAPTLQCRSWATARGMQTPEAWPLQPTS